MINFIVILVLWVCLFLLSGMDMSHIFNLGMNLSMSILLYYVYSKIIELVQMRAVKLLMVGIIFVVVFGLKIYFDFYNNLVLSIEITNCYLILNIKNLIFLGIRKAEYLKS